MRKVLYLMGILDDTDVDWMAANGSRAVVPVGTTLITRGVSIDSLFILLEGKLAVVIGNGVEVAELMSGEVVGEISFVDARPPLTSVVSRTQSVILTLDKLKLKKKLATDTGFASRFYHALALFLSDRLRSTTGRLGYGGPAGTEEAEDPDEFDPDLMHVVSMANVRFRRLLDRVL